MTCMKKTLDEKYTRGKVVIDYNNGNPQRCTGSECSNCNCMAIYFKYSYCPYCGISVMWINAPEKKEEWEHVVVENNLGIIIVE
jgi:hypothetical protein